MALPSKQERIRRKKVMQAAGINVPNTDASWGPWWEKQWKKLLPIQKLMKIIMEVLVFGIL